MSDCCKVPLDAKIQGKALLCRQCGLEGKPVGRNTVEALLQPELRAEVNGGNYALCETLDCPVVYFAGDGTRFTKDQIRIRIGIKETDDPIPVCYCFGVTERMIREEIERTGRSTASTTIRAEVKAGNCRCEAENPSGRCCLGEVIRAEKRAATESQGRDPAFAHP